MQIFLPILNMLYVISEGWLSKTYVISNLRAGLIMPQRNQYCAVHSKRKCGHFSVLLRSQVPTYNQTYWRKCFYVLQSWHKILHRPLLCATAWITNSSWEYISTSLMTSIADFKNVQHTLLPYLQLSHIKRKNGGRKSNQVF